MLDHQLVESYPRVSVGKMLISIIVELILSCQEVANTCLHKMSSHGKIHAILTANKRNTTEIF